MTGLEIALLITSIVTALGSTAAGIYGQQQANKTNIQLAREGQEFEMQQIDKMNTYNTPLNQMERLGQAGLNPRLIYGNQGNTGLQTQTPKAHVPTVQSTMEQVMKTDPLGTLSQFAKIRATEANTQKILSEEELVKAKKLTEVAKEYGITLENLPKEIKNGVIQAIHSGSEIIINGKKASESPYYKEELARAGLTQQNLIKLKADARLKTIETEAWNELDKSNINKPMMSLVKLILSGIKN